MTRHMIRCSPVVFYLATAGCIWGCSDAGIALPDLSLQYPGEPPVKPDTGTTGQPPLGPQGPTCSPDIMIEPLGRALVVTDPEVLARFPLKRVLQQLIDRTPFMSATPLGLIQQLFDTENTSLNGVFPEVTHCDSPDNNAFRHSPAAFCPRTEGKLATSTGFFTLDHPDQFVPIALVNRFDLAPRAGASCGEYRILYAKLSGRTNPSERVFLAFEGILGNPSAPDTINGCLPVAKMWANLQKEADISVVADYLENFYFVGSLSFLPVVSPEHFSFSTKGTVDSGGGYGDPRGRPRRGQIRLSQGMQEPWEFREFHLRFAQTGNAQEPSLFFSPVTTKNNPRAELFDASISLADGLDFRTSFLDGLPKIAAKESFAIQFSPSLTLWNAGSSLISSDPSVDFVARAFDGEKGQTFWSQIQATIAEKQLNADCPPEDPLLPEHLVQRVSMLTCAGCHAPEQYLGTSRSLGCGQTWPNIAQRAHIDESGKLSPALIDSFLPRRAQVLATYLQQCDINAIRESLQPAEAF